MSEDSKGSGEGENYARVQFKANTWVHAKKKKPLRLDLNLKLFLNIFIHKHTINGCLIWKPLTNFGFFFLCYFVGCLCACHCAPTLSKTYNLIESSLAEFYKKSGPNNFWSVAESVHFHYSPMAL